MTVRIITIQPRAVMPIYRTEFVSLASLNIRRNPAALAGSPYALGVEKPCCSTPFEDIGTVSWSKDDARPLQHASGF
jgi:hypothetical protein